MQLDYGEQDDEQQEYTASRAAAPADADTAMDVEEEEDESSLTPAEQAQRRREREAVARGNKFYKLPQQQDKSEQQAQAANEEEVDDEDDATPVEAPSPPTPIGGGLDVRLVALNLTGEPIKQLSTSRLFAYVTACGAAALGLEWINDQSCNVVFADTQSALHALESMSRPSQRTLALPLASDLQVAAAIQEQHRCGEPMDEPIPEILVDQLLLPRRCRNIPRKLYTSIEREHLANLLRLQEAQRTAQSAIPDDAPAIYAEMEAQERNAALDTPELQALHRLRSPLWVRFALESADNKRARASATSEWYAQHGHGAGKEVVTKLLDVQDKKSRGRGNEGQSMLDKLDAELDDLRNRGSEEEEVFDDDDSAPRARGGRGGGRWRHDKFRDNRDRPPVRSAYGGREERWASGAAPSSMDALEEELEHHAYERQRDRSSSPGRRAGNVTPGGHVKIRGRGAMRAPGSSSGGMAGWGDEEPAAGAAYARNDARRGAGGGGMVADREDTRRRGRGGRRNNAGGGDRWQHDASGAAAQGGLEGRLGSNQKLADRFSGGGSLMDRLG